MITVHKYKLDPYNAQVNLPVGAEVLSAGYQLGEICIWAKVDTEQPMEERYFKVFGTGHKIHINMGIDYKFISTVFIDTFVFHVFEVIN